MDTIVDEYVQCSIGNSGPGSELWTSASQELEERQISHNSLLIFFYLLLTNTGCVPGEEVSARVLVRVHQHRLAGILPIFAHKADDTLVAEAAIGCALVSTLICQLHHLVQVGQLAVGHPPIHSTLMVFNAYSCTDTHTITKSVTKSVIATINLYFTESDRMNSTPN